MKIPISPLFPSLLYYIDNETFREISHGLLTFFFLGVTGRACQLFCANLPCALHELPWLYEIMQATCICNNFTDPPLNEVVNGFKTKFGMIQCLGSIDGSHIPVMPPALNHTDYYNRKGYYSMILQAVVDHNYMFRDINIGWPGSVHDALVFVN